MPQLLDMQSGVKYEYDLQDAAKSANRTRQYIEPPACTRNFLTKTLSQGSTNFCLLKTAAREHGQIFRYKVF